MAGGATFRVGQRVQWAYRSGTGYGTVAGIVSKDGSPDTWRYRIRVDNVDRAAHPGEPQFRVHTGADMHPWDGTLPQAVKDQAAKNRS